MDLVSDELKAKLLPVSRRLKEIEKERAERRKVRKRTKAVVPSSSNDAATPTPAAAASAAPAGAEVEMLDATATPAQDGGELEDESIYQARELAELEGLVSEDIKKDTGASVSGLYELVGELWLPESSCSFT